MTPPPAHSAHGKLNAGKRAVTIATPAWYARQLAYFRPSEARTFQAAWQAERSLKWVLAEMLYSAARECDALRAKLARRGAA